MISNDTQQVTTPLPTRATGESTVVRQGGGSVLLFPGSFNPFTIGHKDIVDRGLALADAVVVAIGVHPDKHQERSIDERMEHIRRIFADEPRVSVVAYEGLTADFARQVGATAILRSVRSMKDYEYERDMADINRHINGIDTVLLFASPQYASVSSSVVRELESYGVDVTPFLPTPTSTTNH